MSTKIVITDCDFIEDEWERTQLAGEAEVVYGNCRTEQEVIDLASDADAMLIQYAPITRGVIESLRKCRAISRYGIGVDTIDISAATENGIYVTNVPDYCVDEVSDHACALILAIVRGVPLLDRTVRRGQWDVSLAAPIYACSRMVLGVVGLGKTARRTIEKIKPFGFEILVFDPFVSEDQVAATGAQKVGLDELLTRSDVVSLHAPLTAETRHMMGSAQFALMKNTALLVNTSRGGLVDEGALLSALENHQLGGAALDVLETEPIKADHPLLRCEQVIVTPHAAYYSETSQQELRRRTLLNVTDLLQGKDPGTVLNPEAGEIAKAAGAAANRKG